MKTVTQEIKSFFQMKKLPFGKEVKLEELFIQNSLSKAEQKLHLLIETKGLGILTGRPGTGKSSIIRSLINQLNPSLFKPVYLCHTSVGVTEFYFHICNAFALDAPSRKAKMFGLVKEHVINLNHSNRIHPILIIDEAHLLQIDILKEIRLLTNFEVDSYNGLTVLLCGQDDLHSKLTLTILEALASAITISIKMESLSAEESYSYIEHRINTVREVKDPLFTKNALKLIHESSGGNMRSINTIATASLYKAFYSKSIQIEKEHVASAIQR